MNPKLTIPLPNEHLEKLESDFLYHLGINSKTTNFEKEFGDVKFVCMGGTKNRMFELAKYLQKVLGLRGELVDLCEKAHRYAVFKVGPVLCASHGIGMPSMSILLHEMIKLVSYAKCKDPIFLRIGTSGGVGIPVGTVVVTKDAYNGYIRNEHELAILGERVCRPAKFHEEVYTSLLSCAEPDDDFKTILGNTMAADDFYEGQGRLDGVICEHNEQQKMEFLKKLHNHGVRNIEMEATMFSSLTHHIGIKAGEICVTLVDRLQGDQVTQSNIPKEVLEQRPLTMCGRFIKKHLD
ncbi:uridine phosphorylase 2-like [Episyrphus balteatus]|uniref:uridine phosphorylase 2-like n=1 Tax=Episyrphus balteatus TaxID=286459 RepID=UPI0024865F5F|nr:uridine phosphorylase 2-like [Episyrphus balteatus]XP_055851098.1 uridine phosphorylase 2-like [Episyrphus balteatus]